MNIERFTADERGVSEIVGAILVFALVVMLISIMQTVAVPNQNQEIEVQHTVDVQGDMVKYHQVASEVATSGTEQSVAIQTGTGYPARLLFFNPPRVQGTLETSAQGTVEIDNIRSPDGEVDNYITDDQNGQLALDSRTMQYRGNYNEYQNPPVIKYEYGILYNEYDDASVVANPGTLIDGTDINLLLLAGEYAQTSSTTQSVGVQPVSAPARTVPIEHDGSTGSTGNLRIELQSDLPEQRWEDAYESPTNNVDDIYKPNPNTVYIELDESKTYNLRMSRIALEKDVQKPDGYYVVPAGEGTTSVTEGETTNVKFEVRDEYNNPVSDVEVDVDSPAGPPVSRTTNSDGKITVPITPDSSGTLTTTAYILDQPNVDGCDSTPNSAKDKRCKADFTLQVTDLSINPGSGVRLRDASIVQKSQIDISRGDVEVSTLNESTNIVKTTFEETAGEDRTIASVRMNLYSTDNDGPEIAGMNNSDDSIAIENIDIGGPFYVDSDPEWKNGPDTLTANDKTEYKFYFYDENDNGNYEGRIVQDNDYFVLTVVFENDERAIYFVSPD
jgi:flagellin-like protein